MKSGIFTGLFSQEECNLGRQYEADMCRFICIVGMVFVHTIEDGFYYVELGSGETGLGMFLDILGGICGATLFMLIMGLGLSYSHSFNFKKTFIRGVILFVGGYLLSITRLSTWIIAALAGEIDTSGSDLLVPLFTGDIYQFAGLVLIFFALMRKLNIPDWALFPIAVASLLLSYSIPGDLIEDNPILCVFIGILIRQDGYGTFCFFEWLIYPVLGYLFGKLMRRCTNKTGFYWRLLAISGVLIAIYIGLSFPLSIDIPEMFHTDEAYFTQMPAKVLLSVISLAFFVSLMYFIEIGLHRLIPKARTFILAVSEDLPEIYVVHWLIVGNLSFLITSEMADWYLLVALGVLIVSLVLGHLIHKLVKMIKNKHKQKEATPAS